MLNVLWAGMLIVGIFWGILTRQASALTDGILQGASDSVTLCLTMLGVLSMWSGFLKIAENSGLLTALSHHLSPLLRLLFPGLPKDHPVNGYLSTNILANVLGLGWAATPAGLRAMKELVALNPRTDGTASRDMCTFLILNISSLQLLPVSILAYRQQYQSVSPEIILGPAILATLASTLAGILFARTAAILERK
ncbi:MAG: nucleoside recognition protein [Lachnospiraceae bacterium]|nr:nucleoside recognition protein [Lachnospiraceae bacterium]